MSQSLTEIKELAASLKSKEMYALALRELEDALYGAMAANITGVMSPAATATARNLANTAASSLTDQLTQTQLRSMGDTIARALEQGKRPLDIARELKEVRALDSNRAKRYLKIQDYLEQSGLSDDHLKKTLDREYERLLSDRRKTIARTEGRTATSAARRVEANERKYPFKLWATSQDGRVSDLCEANAAAGIIPTEQAFPSGDQHTPGHPDCRCNVAYLPDHTKVKRNAEIRNKRAQERTRKSKAGEDN